jgi:hypothetical protein
MSKLHYFQRYSSVENTVTNNTLQLINRIYFHSPAKASLFLQGLTGEPFDIGLNISQQEVGAGSVPDGSIQQVSFKILLETKVDSAMNEDQLLRHTKQFNNESQKVLLLLTKEFIGEFAEDALQRKIAEQHSGITFKSVTYEDVCKAAQQLFDTYEIEMRALVEDYIDYCAEMDLLNDSKYLMRIVPCGNSWRLNLKHGMYFQPSERGYRQHAFVGIYKDKAVRALLEIDSVFDVTFEKGELKKMLVQGRQTDDYDDRLKVMIEEALTECGYELENGHRFFCAPEAATAEYRKESFGGIMGARFVNLRDEIGAFSGVKEVAQKLNGKIWV